MGRTTDVATRLGRLFGELVEVVLGRSRATRHERRLLTARDRLLRQDALRDVGARRELEHHVEEGELDDRAQAAGAGLAREGVLGDLDERIVGEDELDRVVAEEALVLADERILRLGEDLDEVVMRELVYGGDDG